MEWVLKWFAFLRASQSMYLSRNPRYVEFACNFSAELYKWRPWREMKPTLLSSNHIQSHRFKYTVRVMVVHTSGLQLHFNEHTSLLWTNLRDRKSVIIRKTDFWTLQIDRWENILAIKKFVCLLTWGISSDFFVVAMLIEGWWAITCKICICKTTHPSSTNIQEKCKTSVK